MRRFSIRDKKKGLQTERQTKKAEQFPLERLQINLRNTVVAAFMPGTPLPLAPADNRTGRLCSGYRYPLTRGRIDRGLKRLTAVLPVVGGSQRKRPTLTPIKYVIRQL